MNNEEEYQRLKIYTDSHPNSILAPVILENWDEILLTSGIAWQYMLEQMGIESSTTSYKPIPCVIENILPRPHYQKHWENALSVLDKTEEYLHKNGFRRGDISYYDCGREAIVFQVKNTPDLLLKLSDYVSRDTPLITNALARRVSHPDPETTIINPISLALVPYLGHSLDPETPRVGMQNIPMSPAVKAKFKDCMFDKSKGIERIIEKQGMEFIDRKRMNMRSHSDVPGVFFIIDRRAVEMNEKTAGTLTPEEEETVVMYKEIADDIWKQLSQKYGLREKAFRAVAQQAHLIQSPEEQFAKPRPNRLR